MRAKLNLRTMFMIGAWLVFSHAATSQNWQLVWQDEFNGSIGPDWVFETGTGSGGWGNNELQYYRQQNASVENGQLVITARQESFGGMNYTSARMKTEGRASWRYGRIEARIQLPSFTGSWPAFWMLGDNFSTVGWPACGEIDIMEHVNTEAQTHGTIHWQDHNNSYASYSGSTGTNVTSYHIYAIEWDASAIRWYVDGNLFHEANISGGINGTHEFHNNFFIILNMAIGGNWPGFNVDNSALPAQMRVDYVRVYQADTGGNNGVVTLYQHCDYGGYSASLNEGNYTLSQLQSLGIQNDDISSLQVQSGYQITMYQHHDFTGNTLVKSSNDNCLVDDGFNDDISSVVVSQASSGGWSTQIEAENYAVMNGVQTESCSEGGLNVGWIDAGDWMVWDVNLPSSGTYNVQYRVASLNGGGTIQLENAGGNPIYGSINVPNTGGWQNWTTISHNVNLNGGQQQIAIYVPSGGYNINWLRLSTGSTARMAGEEETNLESPVSLYPNPAVDHLTISGLDQGGEYVIYNAAGQEALKGLFKPEERHINVRSLKAGTYMLRFSDEIRMRFIKK